MTTSTTLDRAERPLQAQQYSESGTTSLVRATPFDFGSGHVNPRAALDPRLIFDAVPVSTVASESAFSAANRVLDERRSRLKEDILEALICVKDWLFANRMIQDKMSDDIAENFKNLVIAED
ncbi:Subtilisin-like protease [Abeliophyllum distichum]|uniref:Subtilisin-like protease n=1 Tax=Abeliophyllum distichum TaxID=126358 RepID=A0ABD1U2J1_9LAMI